MKLNLALTFITFLTLTSFLMPSCATRKRTANLDVSASTIEDQLTSIGNLLKQINDPVAQKAYNDFIAMHEEDGSTLYYSEAPGSMGTKVDTVIPVDFGQLYQDGSPNVDTHPSKAYAYFVVVQRPEGWRGSLIITNTTGAVTQAASSTQTPNTLPVNAQTATPAANSFVFVAGNDGQTLIPGALSTAETLLPGIMEENEFALEMNLHDRAQLVVRTIDTDEGEDLTDVIQVELGKIVDGFERPIGKVNLVQVPPIK